VQAVSTEELTKSFGWNMVDSFTQHDVQEFLRVLLDKMEEKMKGTPQQPLLDGLFQGRMKSYIRCVDVEYESARTENFLDLQLKVKGIPNLEKSFENYCEIEKLEGDNQYRAEGR
jgi:ubiquitin carboxyl-terminal hydrolase 7